MCVRVVHNVCVCVCATTNNETCSWAWIRDMYVYSPTSLSMIRRYLTNKFTSFIVHPFLARSSTYIVHVSVLYSLYVCFVYSMHVYIAHSRGPNGLKEPSPSAYSCLFFHPLSFSVLWLSVFIAKRFHSKAYLWAQLARWGSELASLELANILLKDGALVFILSSPHMKGVAYGLSNMERV